MAGPFGSQGGGVDGAEGDGEWSAQLRIGQRKFVGNGQQQQEIDARQVEQQGSSTVDTLARLLVSKQNQGGEWGRV